MATKDYQTFRVDLNNQTMVFMVYRNRLPQLIYWGSQLPNHEDLETLVRAKEQSVPLAQLNETSRISLTPELGWGFTGYPGILLSDAKGNAFFTQFKFVDFIKSKVKKKDKQNKDSEQIDLKFISEFNNLDKKIRLIHEFIWYDHNMLTSQSKIENLGEEIMVNWLSAPAISLPESIMAAQFWGGKWIKEFQKTQTLLASNSIILRENRRGRTSHESIPAVVFPFPNSTQTEGKAYGFYLGWSGNHRLLVEQLHSGAKQFLIGSLEEPGEVRLRQGELFSTPILFGCFSQNGINEIRKTFHQHIRSHLISHNPKDKPRKVYSNSWEAVYFDHDFQKLKELIDNAAELGAERFVLDDGWFKHRNDDTTSLGDWEVDPSKYPHDLFPLIDYVKSKGLDFGLWLEPEMISEKSKLYQEHPDWVLHPSGLERIEGRNQLVLDLSRTDVFDFLYKTISELIKKYSLSYIKWDHNRTLVSEKTRLQTESLYILWDKLKTNFPEVEIESCSSGGGRIDLGILNWADRFWLSDSNDPVERWRMQFEAGTFFPPEVIGSHVGPMTCHTSNRMTSIDFRCLVAISSHFGYECDLTQLSKEDKIVLEKMTTFYKTNREFLHQAQVYALNPRNENQTYSLNYVNQDKSKFILFIGCLDSEPTGGSPIIQLAGLDPNTSYHLTQQFGSKLKNKLNQKHFNDFSSENGFTLTGKSLMEIGFRLPVSMPQTIWVIEGTKA